jgi:hypothetical protein
MSIFWCVIGYLASLIAGENYFLIRMKNLILKTNFKEICEK